MTSPTPPTQDTSITNTTRTIHVSTNEAYDAWASVYDIDGNMLQAVDDTQLETMLPNLLTDARAKQATSDQKLRIIDIGCGTGRNTLKLVRLCAENDIKAEIVGIDASEKMLELARVKLEAYDPSTGSGGDRRLSCEFMHVDIARVDFLGQSDSLNEALRDRAPFDLAISTLVLEHIRLNTFFKAVEQLTRTGSTLLLTNMHPGMGAKSQAGFMGTDQDGEPVKIRGTSYIHGVEETVQAANRFGWTCRGGGDSQSDGTGGVNEVMVRPEMVDTLGPRAKKWVGERVWYGIVATRQV